MIQRTVSFGAIKMRVPTQKSEYELGIDLSEGISENITNVLIEKFIFTCFSDEKKKDFFKSIILNHIDGYLQL